MMSAKRLSESVQGFGRANKSALLLTIVTKMRCCVKSTPFYCLRSSFKSRLLPLTNTQTLLAIAAISRENCFLGVALSARE